MVSGNGRHMPSSAMQSAKTISLAPYNYHRVHAPFDAELVAARYVPGDLFSVIFSRLVLAVEIFFGIDHPRQQLTG